MTMKTSPEQKIKDEIRRTYAQTYPNCIFSLTNHIERLKAENAELGAAIAVKDEALREIADGEMGEVCRRCEGNGAIYADGKAHYYSEGAPTIPCPNCGGIGRVSSVDVSEIARRALAATIKEVGDAQ